VGKKKTAEFQQQARATEYAVVWWSPNGQEPILMGWTMRDTPEEAAAAASGEFVEFPSYLWTVAEITFPRQVH